MKKNIAGGLLLILSLSLLGCQMKQDAAFTIKLICESDDIYQLYYSAYLGEKRCSIGGVANPDQTALSPERPIDVEFTQMKLYRKDDVSNFVLTLSPFGKDDKKAIATTEKLAIPAEYGKTYTVVFSGDRLQGYTLSLKE